MSAHGPTTYAPTTPTKHKHTVELTDEDLRIVRTALETYLEDLGHEEADLIRQIHSVSTRFPPPHEREASR